MEEQEKQIEAPKENLSRWARLFLRLDRYVELFFFPVLFLCGFVLIERSHILAPYFPWLQLAVYLCLLTLFIRALALAQREDVPDFLSEADRKRLDRFHAASRFVARIAYLGDKEKFPKRAKAFFTAALVFFALYALSDGESEKFKSLFAYEGRAASPRVTVWITPPDYTGRPPEIIASPSGDKQANGVLELLKGSSISVHTPGKGEKPTLQVNGSFYELEEDGHGDYGLTKEIEKGSSIALSRGWLSLGFWRVSIKKDNPPRIEFTATPSASERKTVRISYKASDDLAVKKITLVITPTGHSALVRDKAVELPLPAPEVPKIEETLFPDLTSNFLAGTPVVLQLRAEDGAGNQGFSEKIPMVLPERKFAHPLAQTLIEERKQLLFHDDPKQRNEAAGVMAGIAHQRAYYGDDPVVLLALRTGAMRLALNSSTDSLAAAVNLMWNAAVRIEEGGIGLKAASLRQAQFDLGAAIDQNMPLDEIDSRIDTLSMCLGRYLDEAATQLNRKSPETVSLQLSYKEQILTPGDLLRSVQAMHDLAAQHAFDKMRMKLGQIQQIMENVHPQPVKLTPQQKAAVLQFQLLKKLVEAQQILIDDTLRASRLGPNLEAGKRLAVKQRQLLKKLQTLLGSVERKSSALMNAAAAMRDAADQLEQKGVKEAIPKQEEALRFLRQGMVALLEGLPEDLGDGGRRAEGAEK
jgi:hypothetical protein